MTRDDFINDVEYFGELISFCDDNDIDICRGIYSSDTRDDFIDDSLLDMARHNNWRELLNILEDLNSDNDYYYYSDEGDDWEGLNEFDFEDYKRDVLEYGDNNGLWDEPEDEDEDEDGQDEDAADCKEEVQSDLMTIEELIGLRKVG